MVSQRKEALTEYEHKRTRPIPHDKIQQRYPDHSLVLHKREEPNYPVGQNMNDATAYYMNANPVDDKLSYLIKTPLYPVVQTPSTATISEMNTYPQIAALAYSVITRSIKKAMNVEFRL